MTKYCNSGLKSSDSNSKNQFGYTLIEVMAAMIILTSGLLGLAYMQILSIQFGQDSYNRTQLLFSSNELIDMMRALQISLGDGSEDHVAFTTTSRRNSVCVPGQPTAQNLITCFYQEISENLPYGTADISLDGSNFVVSVFWSERDASRNLSDNEIALSKIDCENSSKVGLARVWSTGLNWPFGNAPSKPLCMASRSWSVKIANSTIL